MIILLGVLILFWVLVFIGLLQESWRPYYGFYSWCWLILPPFVVAQIWFY